MTERNLVIDPPLRRDAAENRRRVLAAAESVFAEHGIEASVDAVIEAAGVGTGTFYRRFPNKDALLEELVGEMLEQVIGLARDALEGDGGDGKAFEQFLFEAGEYSVRKAALFPSLCTPSSVRANPELQEAFDACLSELLLSARDAGRVDSEVTEADVRDVLRAVTGIVTIGGPEGDWKRHIGIWLAGARPRSS